MVSVTQPALSALEQLFADTVDLDLAGGEIHVVWTPLPGRLVSSVTRINDVIWIVIDETKPMARAHTAQLIADARAACGPGSVTRNRNFAMALPNQRQAGRLEVVG